MIPPIYTQTTPKEDKVRPGLACDPKDTRTRQEFKKDTDVNFLVKKYGGNIPMGNVRFGIQEFGVDRLEALQRMESAQARYDALPPEVRAEYPSWDSVMTAIVNGTFKAPVADEVSSSAEGAEPKAP